MAWSPFKIIPKNFLGIDIGTSSIKMVELQRVGGRVKLENYGELKPRVLYKKPFRTLEKSTLLLSSQDISRGIRAIIQEAKIKTKRAAFSIPDFSTFYTTFKLPPMTEEEIPGAVRFTARQHIPLPLSEVALDWSIIKKGSYQKKKIEGLKILLVAVPNEVIHQYQEIADFSGLELFALEAEAFSLSRSLVKKDKKTVILADIGAQSTTVSVVDGGALQMSHSFDVSGNEFSEVLAKALSVDYDTAEGLKEKYGLRETGEVAGKSVAQILLPLVDIILTEIKKISQSFSQAETKEIESIVLAGGNALIPNLKEYFQTQLEKEIEITNPFADIFYPPILEKTLEKMGPSYAVAAGIALRELE